MSTVLVVSPRSVLVASSSYPAQGWHGTFWAAATLSGRSSRSDAVQCLAWNFKKSCLWLRSGQGRTLYLFVKVATETLKISASATSSAEPRLPSIVRSSRCNPKMPHFSDVACGRSQSHFASNSIGFFRINVTTLALIMLRAAFMAHCNRLWEMAWKRQFLQDS